MSEESLDAIQAVAENSGLWQGARALARGWSSAWNTAWAGRLVRAATVRAHEATPARRVRLGALVVAWACAWHLAGLVVLPAYVTSGLPRVWFVAAGTVALFVAAAAGALVRAWSGSALVRAVRRTRAVPSE